MLNSYERWVFFHHLVLDSRPLHAPMFHMNELIYDLEEMVKADKAFKLVNNEEACYRIRELKIDEEQRIARILFQYSNSNATDPVFGELATDKLRAEPKLDGEGVAVSAHAILKLDPTEEDGNEYLFLVEEIPGLGRSSLEPFLKTMFKNVSKGRFLFEDEENNGRKRIYSPNVKVLATPSQKFAEELDGAKVDGVELVKRIKVSHFDEESHYREEVQTLRLKVVDEDGGKPGVLDRLRRKAKDDGYDDIKIRYTKKGGKSRTTVMGTSTEDLKDMMVGRVEFVDHSPGLEQCCKSIVTSYANKLIALLDE